MRIFRAYIPIILFGSYCLRRLADLSESEERRRSFNPRLHCLPMLSTLLVFSLFSALRPVRTQIHSSIPEDTFAFPKYRLSFLNGLPLQNQTAERWLRDGLRGGEQEFLDNWHPNTPKGIDSGGLLADEVLFFFRSSIQLFLTSLCSSIIPFRRIISHASPLPKLRLR